MLVGQRNGCGRGQRDALVGGAEQHVDFDAGVDHRRGIGAAQLGQCGTGIDPTHVEEVRALPARLESEFTKAQDVALKREIDEVALIVVHGASRQQ